MPMSDGQEISFVQAMQGVFNDPNGNPSSPKLTIDEFKSLTHEDRTQLRDLLITAGLNVAPLKTPTA